MQASEVSAGDFVWLLGSLCQLNRLPFDAQLALQRFPAPHTVRDFIEAARSLGFKTGEGSIAKPNFPCVAFLKGETPKPAILLKGDADRRLYFVAGEKTPETVPAGELAARFDPAVILVRHETANAGPAQDGAPAALPRRLRHAGRGRSPSRHAQHHRIPALAGAKGVARVRAGALTLAAAAPT